MLFEAIDATGEDATTFLQSQLTCDLNTITHELSLGAYCDLRGRMVANFYIQTTETGLRLWLPNQLASIFLKTIQKYAIFSKITLTQNDAIQPSFSTDRSSYIHEKIAWLTAETSLLFTPQMIDWEKLGGVSFNKGCFLGQEVVARTQYLGKLKRHLHLFNCDNDANESPKPGEKLLDTTGNTVGIICDAITENSVVQGLAVIQDTALNTPILLSEKTIELSEAINPTQAAAMEIKSHHE